MTKKRKITLICAGVIFILLLVSYFAFVRPLVNTNDSHTAGLELVEGETEGPNGRYLLIPHIERDNIESIKVHNAGGDYAFVRDPQNNSTFMIDGYRGVGFSDDSFSALVVASGYVIARERVTAEASSEDYTSYGLDTPLASWVITTKGGDSYKVNLGSKLISGDGYYAAVAGRDCIYVLSTTVENSILRPIEQYVNPLICAGMTNETYFTADNFTILHNGEPFLAIKQLPKSEYSNPDAMAETKLVYPEGYKTNDSYFFNIMMNMISFAGESTAYLGTDEEKIAQYGLDDPYYSVYFTCAADGASVEYYIFVSELQEDGYYYASSNLYNYTMIARFPKESFYWLESDLVNWVYNYPIMLNISSVSSIYVDTGDRQINFDLTHGTDSNKKATLEISSDTDFLMNNSEVYNFRNFYKVLLSVQIMGNSELDETEKEKLISDDTDRMATIRFKMLDGEEYEYSFYRYSSRRALLTVNGSGEFYVLADWIEKIISDTEKLLSGIEINPDGKN